MSYVEYYIQKYSIQEWKVTVYEEKSAPDGKILRPNELDLLVQRAKIVIHLSILLENV